MFTKREAVQGDSGDCVVTGKGRAVDDVDFNVVLVCRDGEDLAHVSARVEPGSHVTKIIESVEPGAGLLSKCAGIDYIDPIVKYSRDASRKD